MRFLTLFHRWVGGLVGLLLAVIGLSGTILLFEERWITLPHAGDPLDFSVSATADMLETLTSPGMPEFSRVTLASEDFGLHLAIFANGGGAYVSQGGEVVERWASDGARPELWLFDLHHYLFVKPGGEYVTGALGLAGLFFVISGVILWWRTRKTFVLRVWPKRMTRSAIVRHHRDLGVVTAPMLLLSLVTGTLMIFPAMAQLFLPAPVAQPGPPGREAVANATADPDWHAILSGASSRYPDAAVRRVQWQPGEPVFVRLRQPEEWTPNGRTYAYFAPDGRLLATRAPFAEPGSRFMEKLYPLHAGKVGGLAWKLALAVGGLALTVLGLLATFSFWRSKVN